MEHISNKLPAWKESKEAAQKDYKTVHFATLMDLCHLKHRIWTRSSRDTNGVSYYVVMQ